MRPFAALLLFAAMLLAARAHAQPQTINSAGPDAVAVTIYRAPHRGAEDELDLEWLQGYALVTERRTVAIPAGRAVIRFEGVAGGILPESAIVTGLPDGVREKNLDADLLGPRSLYARSYGRPVTIRREIGRGVIEEPAIIRSGADGAAILQTRDGFIAASCGQGDDSLIYDAVPAGLSAKPTLSVETESGRAGQAVITLSYLAWGFDWEANYVATMRPDGKTADLFGWVTLANGDVTSFADADAMVVAGRVRREDSAPGEQDGEDEFEFSCFGSPVYAVPVPAPPDYSVSEALQRVPGVAMAGFGEGEDIVVTGIRMRQEELGDLKLYVVPNRTTVAAKSQKQVMLLDKPAVPVDVIYLSKVEDEDVGDPMITLRARNREDQGLGLPLPAGKVAVFEPLGERRLLLGEGAIEDKAVDEEVEIGFAEALEVAVDTDETDAGKGWEEYALTVTNANPHPIRYEADFHVSDSYRLTKPSRRLGRKHGRYRWAVDVPANGTATLRYRLVEQEGD